MRYSIEQFDSSNEFDITVSGITREKAKEIAKVVEPLLFPSPVPAKPYNTEGPFVIDLKTVREVAQDYRRQRETIGAIRFVRAITGWGLKEAKDFCDALPRQNF